MRTRRGSGIFAWIRLLRSLWKLLSWIWGVLLIGAGINIASSWSITKYGQWDLHGTPLGWLRNHLTITLPIAGALLLLTILSYLASRQMTPPAKEQPLSTLTPTHQQNRTRMKAKLQEWYHQFLDDSLQQETRLNVNLAEKPDLLANPVSQLVKDVHLPERPLPVGTSIIQVYQDAHQELLVLGEPGSGKSTQLYTLAQHLLTLTETDPMAPLPFVFALSSWAVKRASLEQWMAEQLTTIYQMPKKLAQQWIENEQILPLLDGLDETEEQARPLCIREINRYHREHPLSLVICSRTREYATAACTERLELQRAVEIQPLTTSQIEITLKQGGRSLAGLRAAYKQNATLQELASTPLFLNLLILTYQGIKVRDLPAKGDTLQRQVFDHYVQRIVERKGNSTRYPLDRTNHWLTYLARQLRRHHQTTFAIELLQPNWLPQSPRFAYRRSLGSLTGVYVGLISGLGYGLRYGLIFGLTSGLISGLGYGLIFMLMGELEQKTTPDASITFSEQLKWSWKTMPFRMIGTQMRLDRGLFFGLIGGLDGGLLIGKMSDGPLYGLIGGLLIFGLIYGLIGVFSSKQHIERTTLLPGEGLRHSFDHGLIFGLIFGLLGGLGYGSLIGGLSGGLDGGLLAGLLAGMLAGLGACVQHLVLRFWLWRSGYFPLHVIAFLEDARARHLLKRVGGTYQFIHPLFLEYFVEHEDGISPKK